MQKVVGVIHGLIQYGENGETSIMISYMIFMFIIRGCPYSTYALRGGRGPTVCVRSILKHVCTMRTGGGRSKILKFVRTYFTDSPL